MRTVLIHGDRSQRQRQEALEAFAAGHVGRHHHVGVAARGGHVPAPRTVLNYDVARLPVVYV
ncbi:MAG: helicase-related protein, partial [Phycisphaerales bacterium]